MYQKIKQSLSEVQSRQNFGFTKSNIPGIRYKKKHQWKDISGWCDQQISLLQTNSLPRIPKIKNEVKKITLTQNTSDPVQRAGSCNLKPINIKFKIFTSPKNSKIRCIPKIGTLPSKNDEVPSTCRQQINGAKKYQVQRKNDRGNIISRLYRRKRKIQEQKNLQHLLSAIDQYTNDIL